MTLSHYPLTDSYDQEFLVKNMMGPNAMRVTEELTAYLSLRPGMRVLDLGCGMGISSILLAEKYDAKVFACDLWISPTDNAKRFAALGLEDKIIPISVDAAKGLPFAHEYFDVLLSVDAYHYFGANESMLPSLLPYLKKGGHIAVAAPGLKEEFVNGEVPAELQPFWHPDMNTFHSCGWWEALWRGEPGVTVEICREMDCCKQAWDEWLTSPDPHAVHDVGMMRVEGGKYFNLVQITGSKN